MTLEGFTQPWPRGLTLFYLWLAWDGDRKVETKSISLRWLISWGLWVSRAPWWCPWRGTPAVWLWNAYTGYNETKYWKTWCFAGTDFNLSNAGMKQNCTTNENKLLKGLSSFLHIYNYTFVFCFISNFFTPAKTIQPLTSVNSRCIKEWHTYTVQHKSTYPCDSEALSSSHHGIWYDINVGKLVPYDPINSSVL